MRVRRGEDKSERVCVFVTFSDCSHLLEDCFAGQLEAVMVVVVFGISFV